MRTLPPYTADNLFPRPGYRRKEIKLRNVATGTTLYTGIIENSFSWLPKYISCIINTINLPSRYIYEIVTALCGLKYPYLA